MLDSIAIPKGLRGITVVIAAQMFYGHYVVGPALENLTGPDSHLIKIMEERQARPMEMLKALDSGSEPKRSSARLPQELAQLKRLLKQDRRRSDRLTSEMETLIQRIAEELPELEQRLSALIQEALQSEQVQEVDWDRLASRVSVLKSEAWRRLR